MVPPAATVIFAIVVHHRCNPTNDGVPAASPRPSPPLRSPSPPLPSRPLRPLDRPWRRHGPACGVDALPPGPTRQVPLPHAHPSAGYGPIATAPPSLSGGRRYTLIRFSGRRRRSGDGDGSTVTLMVVPGNPAPRRRRRDDDAVTTTPDRHGPIREGGPTAALCPRNVVGPHCCRLASPISIKQVNVGIFIISSYVDPVGFFRGGKYFLFPQNNKRLVPARPPPPSIHRPAGRLSLSLSAFFCSSILPTHPQ